MRRFFCWLAAVFALANSHPESAQAHGFRLGLSGNQIISAENQSEVGGGGLYLFNGETLTSSAGILFSAHGAADSSWVNTVAGTSDPFNDTDTFSMNVVGLYLSSGGVVSEAPAGFNFVITRVADASVLTQLDGAGDFSPASFAVPAQSTNELDFSTTSTGFIGFGIAFTLSGVNVANGTPYDTSPIFMSTFFLPGTSVPNQESISLALFAAVVPEPSGILLGALVLSGGAFFAWRRRGPAPAAREERS
jgi:hypothetical protein